MYRDAQLEFSVAQVLTATAVSTNSIDTGAAGESLAGADSVMYLVVRMNAAATAAGAATVDFVLQTDSDPAFGTAVTLFDSGVIAKTALTANTWVIRTVLPLGAKQYLRMNYTVATGPLTAGTVDAFLTRNIDVRR